MEQRKFSTKIAGIDVSKAWLDVAVHGVEAVTRVRRTPEGLAELGPWLGSLGVSRVGLEATGGYERLVVGWLQEQGLEVVLHQPLEVRLFGRLKRMRAKNDVSDARLIAAATAQTEALKAANDPSLADLAQRLTAYEQASDLLAKLKTCIEHVDLPDLKAGYEVQILQLELWKQTLAADLLQHITAHEELARRHRLLQSLPGVGPLIAAVLVVRMPELGAMQRGQAASLIGVAPYDRDSGKYKGHRFISGGRGRPRRFLYLAALAAKRCDQNLKAFAERLAATGKPPKVAIVAVMRKLIEAANLVLARSAPWVAQT